MARAFEDGIFPPFGSSSLMTPNPIRTALRKFVIYSSLILTPIFLTPTINYHSFAFAFDMPHVLMSILNSCLG